MATRATLEDDRGPSNELDGSGAPLSSFDDETTQSDELAGTAGPTSILTRSKIYALIAVCLMSIGSHFAMYLLGPLKSRLHREMGTSNSQFSLLIASFNLNSTWTPLVAGLFVTRFGTPWSSVATTFCVLAGQVILFFGVASSHLIIMTLGMFTFGLGTTPLSVVQETLVSHLAPSKHLGLSLALGLVSGKSSSFISSLVSLPLADQFGDLMPFAIAVSLCCLSFLGNWLRLLNKWGLEDGQAVEVEEKRRVSWGGVGDLGDVFWIYIGLNVLSGAIWQPFLHLSANLLQIRYSSTEAVASEEASVLLVGAIVLYPIVSLDPQWLGVGYVTDRFSPSTPRTTFILLHISSVLTLLAYSYLLLPPSWTGSPWLAMFLFTTGHGMATLLLVILVPRLLPVPYIPLGLGSHKSMEMASSSLSQTLAGLWLDRTKGVNPSPKRDSVSDAYAAGEGLLRIFWMINILQLFCVFLLWRFEARRRHRTTEKAQEYERLPMSAVSNDSMRELYNGGDVEDTSFLDEDHELDLKPDSVDTERMVGSALAADEMERRRGKWCFHASLGFIALVWLVFLVAALRRL